MNLGLVQRWLSGESTIYRYATVALCVVLRMPYEVNLEFIKVFNYSVEALTDENILLRFFIDTAYSETLTVRECNKLMKI